MPENEHKNICNECHEEDDHPKAKYCRFCAKPLVKVTKVSNCGKCGTASGEGNFCQKCGNKLIEEVPAGQPPQPAPPQAPYGPPVQAVPSQPSHYPPQGYPQGQPQVQQPAQYPTHHQAQPYPVQQPYPPQQVQPQTQMQYPQEGYPQEEQEDDICPNCGVLIYSGNADRCPNCGYNIMAEEEEGGLFGSMKKMIKDTLGNYGIGDFNKESTREQFLRDVLEYHSTKQLTRLLKLYDLPISGSQETKIDNLVEQMDDEIVNNHEYRKLLSRVLVPMNRETLWEICDQFNIDKRGDPIQIIDKIKNTLVPVPAVDASTITLPNIVTALNDYQPLNFYTERDLEDDLFAELRERFGYENVFRQVMTPGGKIDLHIGPMYGQGGIGIEIKLPKNKSDIDRLQGQIYNYMQKYGSNVVVYFLSKDSILSQYVVQFQQFCQQYNVHVIRK